MATILKIKRSSNNPTATPSALGQGELAYGEGTSTYNDAAGGTVTSFGKLFVGRGSETNGEAANIDCIGGKYFTDLLDHGHGTLTANSALIVDSDSKIDALNVDNITLDANTVSTTNSNGDLNFDTNGNGDYIFAGAATVGTNEFKITDGSTDRFVVDSFSGALDITTPSLSAADTVLNIGSTWNNSGNTFKGIAFNVTNTNSAPASRLLELSVGGTKKFDVDVSGNVSLAGTVTFDAATSFSIQDDEANAFEIKEGSNSYFNIATTNSSELITFGTADVTIDNDLNVNGGDIKTTATSFDLINENATTVNFAGAGQTIKIGADGAHTTTFGNGTVVGTQSTQNVFNTTATTVNAFGAAETIAIGKSGDHTTTLGSGTLVGTETTQNVFNATATTVNAFGGANTINMGTASTVLDLGNIRISGNTISTDSNSATELIIDPFPDAGDAGGDVIIRGNLQVAGTTTTVNSTEMSVNDPVFTIGDSVTEKTVTAVAASGQTAVVIDNPSGVVEGATITGTGIANGSTVSNVRIEFNVTGTPFSTAPSGGDNIYFYDGTSFSLIGTYVSKTASSVTIDLAANISTRGDDFYNGNNLTSASSGSPSAAVSASITKVDTKVFKTTTLTLSANTTSSVAAETKLTISQATDDNLDRGIQFKYLTSNTSKVGFFGYDDDTAYFTFIPDATNNSNLFSGTKGEAWFKTVKLDDGVNKGVPYFNSDKELTTTVAAGTSDITTSHKILTSNGAAGEPIWTTTIDGGTY